MKTSTKTETIAIKVTPEEKELIQKLAERDDVSVSKFLYRIVFKEVQKDANSSKPKDN